MVEMLIGILEVTLLFAVPIAWRVRQERTEDRALAVHAGIAEVLRRTLGGESLVSISVVPMTAWGRGHVMLSTPAGCESLLEAVWHPVLEVLPRGYELVIHGTPPADDRQVRAAA